MGRASFSMSSPLYILLAATLLSFTAGVPIYSEDYTSSTSPPTSNATSLLPSDSEQGYSCSGGAAAAGILFLIVFLCCCSCIKKVMCGGCRHGRCGGAHGRCSQRCRTSPAAPVPIRANVVPADGTPMDSPTAKTSDTVLVKDGAAMQPLCLTGTVPGDVITDPTPPYTSATGQL